VTDELFSTAVVAARLGLSPESVLRRFRRGELAGYRLASNVLRFRAADVDAYLTTRREEKAAHSPGEEVAGATTERRYGAHPHLTQRPGQP
jgi:hypothetical protein